MGLLAERRHLAKVAAAAGITVEQARLALAASAEPPPGPIYLARMAQFREMCEIMGDRVLHLDDVQLEKRLRRYARTARLIDYAKAADAGAPPPP